MSLSADSLSASSSLAISISVILPNFSRKCQVDPNTPARFPVELYAAISNHCARNWVSSNRHEFTHLTLFIDVR
jgi:hypothetical protein